MNTLLLAVAAALALLILAGLRPALGRVLWAGLGVLARSLTAVRRMVEVTRRVLLRGARSTRSALSFQAPQSTPHPASPWDVVAPMVFLVLAAFIVAGDLVLAALRMGALLGLPMEGLPVPGSVVDVLAGVLFLAVLATFGLLLFDVLHVTPTVRPFGLAGDRARRVLAALAWAGTALSVVAGIVFLVWGQGAVLGTPDDDLATLFVAVFAVLLVLASVISVAGALGSALVLWLAGQLLLAGAVSLLGWSLRVVVALVEGIHELTQAILQFAAWPGETGWNWLCSREFARTAGFLPLPSTSPLPPLGSVGTENGVHERFVAQRPLALHPAQP